LPPPALAVSTGEALMLVAGPSVLGQVDCIWKRLLTSFRDVMSGPRWRGPPEKRSLRGPNTWGHQRPTMEKMLVLVLVQLPIGGEEEDGVGAAHKTLPGAAKDQRNGVEVRLTVSWASKPLVLGGAPPAARPRLGLR
jgi:hypothetical protein